MIGIADVQRARERIAAGAHVTPLLSSRLLGEAAGGTVFLKAESLQRTGSFKFRGALNAVRSLDSRQLARGVATYSSGNHAQALALAARLAGCRAVVFMPQDAPRIKVEATRAYGAEVRFAGTTSAERKAAAEAAAESEGLVIVPPFDHPGVVAGQGTAGLEIAEQAPGADVVLVPVGGGGLLSGVALALSAVLPAARVYGVEPRSADCLSRALAAGEPVTIEPPRTIADGLKPLRVGDLPFSILRDRVAASLLVDDAEILRAVRFLALRARLVVEPSGAVGVAALLSGKLPLEGRTAVAVLSGGNVEPALLARLLASPSGGA
ncbi:MAG: threonine/serine dehydratase [Planctomycetes bacterium]|nr:threonine/serine dehydratase [Planctomycetota bacterium]